MQTHRLVIRALILFGGIGFLEGSAPDSGDRFEHAFPELREGQEILQRVFQLLEDEGETAGVAAHPAAELGGG